MVGSSPCGFHYWLSDPFGGWLFKESGCHCLADWCETATVNRAGSVLTQAIQMFCGGVALVAIKAVSRKLGVVFTHEPVSRDFRED